MQLRQLVSLTALLLPCIYASVAPQMPLIGDEITQECFDDNFSLNLSEPRILQLGENERPIMATELKKIQLRQAGVNFMDITESGDITGAAGPTLQNYRYHPLNNIKLVNSIISKLSTEGPKAHLIKFTSFRTRYYRSASGRDSQRWLLSQVKEITSKANRTDIAIYEFKHSWGQNTIVARFNGTASDRGTVVIGAHQDSTNVFPFLAAPGADDDGSGTVSILEAYRALLASDFKPSRPLEFHWYSAEEGGLLGSQAVAKAYAIEQVSIYGMIQMDMTAWVKKGTREEVGVITDFTDPSLTEFNKKLIDEYLDIPYVETQCGYACSDHASWGRAGYPSSFTIESSFENSNHNIHSTNDRIDISPEFSFEHMLEFSKLAVAFAVELAGPVDKLV